MHFDLSWLDYKTQIGIVYFIPIIIDGVIKTEKWFNVLHKQAACALLGF